MKNTEIFGNNRIDICEQAISFDGLLFSYKKWKRVDKDEKTSKEQKSNLCRDACIYSQYVSSVK